MAENSIDLSAAREETIKAIRKEYPPLLTSAHVAELMQCTRRIQSPRDVPRHASLCQVE